jgi:aminoglycoside phosphotransferase family enzyme
MPGGIAVLSSFEPESQQEQRKKDSKKFSRFIKVFSNCKFLVYQSMQNVDRSLRSLFVFSTEHSAHLLRLVPERIYPKFRYRIVDEIVSTTTRVIFTRRKQNGQPVCLKLWDFENICNPKLVNRDKAYLIEGFEFNRRFAPSVYLGIAPVYISEEQRQAKKIRRGKLMEKPKEQDIKNGMKYALVMRRLDESLRLDHQIYNQKLIDPVDFEFMASEVARMHKQLANSPDDKGKPLSIGTKLEINRQLFEESLKQLAKEFSQIRIQAQDCSFINQYLWISNIMALSYAEYIGLIQQRYDSHCIKRCHGDLKTTNLWIDIEKSNLLGLIKQPRQLFAIDCIDFNPEFCHIDTLSDVAMLAIDLEMLLLTDWLKAKTGSSKQEQEGKSLIGYFLDCYLREMAEDGEKWNPLLEYYMTEKSMVCAYVSILYDERPFIGKKYLEVALSHAQKLEKMLTHSDSSRQTPSLLVSP